MGTLSATDVWQCLVQMNHIQARSKTRLRMTVRPWSDHVVASQAMCLKRSLCRYVGTDGIYTHTTQYEQDLACLICSSGVPLHAPPSSTLQQARPVPACIDLCCQRCASWSPILSPVMYLATDGLLTEGVLAAVHE